MLSWLRALSQPARPRQGYAFYAMNQQLDESIENAQKVASLIFYVFS